MSKNRKHNLPRPRSVRWQLFFSYSALIAVTSIIFAAVFYFYASETLKRRANESLESMVSSVSQRLDDRIRSMDTVSMTVAYSILLDDSYPRSRLSELLPRDAGGNRGALQLVTMLQSIIGPFQTVPEVYIHTAEGWSIGAGLFNGLLRARLADAPWYSAVAARSGELYLTAPHADPAISGSIQVYSDTRYVSLCRLFFDLYGKPQGVIEVEQSVDALFANLRDAVPTPQSQVLVFDDHGDSLFRSSEADVLEGTSSAALLDAAKSGHGSLLVPGGQGPTVITFTRSSYTGWVTAIAEPESEVLAPLYSFTTLMLGGSLLLLLLTLALSFMVARRLTDPIKVLHGAIRRFDSDALLNSEPVILNSGLNELDALNVAFEAMHRKLKESIADLIRIRSHEAQTRILALQSQMNPHFLYNLLSTVMAMADEGMNGEIVKLCRSLSSVFRYVSANLDSFVELATEIAFVREYLRCVEYRLNDGLQATIDLPPEVRPIRVPKLIVQPLVENALKHGNAGEGPLSISITAQRDTGRWRVSVADRGPGFRPETLAILREKMRTVDLEGPQEPMDPNGIGLTNIYTRLVILYGSEAQFEVRNVEGGGASVTIGGSIDGR